MNHDTFAIFRATMLALILAAMVSLCIAEIDTGMVDRKEITTQDEEPPDTPLLNCVDPADVPQTDSLDDNHHE